MNFALLQLQLQTSFGTERVRVEQKNTTQTFFSYLS